MTRWVDHPDWGDAIASALVLALANVISHEAESRQVWILAGLEPADFPNSPTARIGWNAMLRDAEAAGKLEKLLQTAVTLRSALAADVAPALAQRAGVHWYRWANQYKYRPRLLGPGATQAMINRGKLSENLEQIVDYNFPVCTIRGKSGAGKSYSRHLIQQLAAQPGIQSQPIRVDIATSFKDGVNARRFASWLADRLGMNSTFNVDENTHETSIADALATTFLARFPDLPARNRWIFIDGLDRPGVTDDVHVFVGHLALAATSGELPGTRLFITGHRGDFHADVMDVLCDEEIDPIDRSQLVRFFTDIATHIGKPLSAVEAEQLADKVLARAPLTDLRRLGRAAGEVAHEHFKGQDHDG